MVSVVIVNWNSGQQLRECLDSIEKFGGGFCGSVIVVDNGSTDRSMEFDGFRVPSTLILAQRNLGFAKACNLGARHCVSDYILFLNPDARLMEGTLQKALAFMGSEAAKRIGICGARLLGENGLVHRHCARFPDAWSYVWHSLGLGAIAPRLFRLHFMTEFDHLSSREVDHVIGAFFLVRRSLFDALGGFDERFFVYLEDLDFSLRAKHAGWNSYYLAEAVAYHKGGGTSEQIKARRLFYSLRSRLLYAFKNFSWLGAWGTLTATLFAELPVRTGYAIARMRWVDAANTVHAYRLLMAELPAVLRAALAAR